MSEPIGASEKVAYGSQIMSETDASTASYKVKDGVSAGNGMSEGPLAYYQKKPLENTFALNGANIANAQNTLALG